MLPIKCIQLPCRNIDVSNVHRTGIGQGTWRRATARCSRRSPRPNGSRTRTVTIFGTGSLEVFVVPDLIGGRRVRERELVPFLLLDQEDRHVDRDQPVRDVRDDLGAVQVAKGKNHDRHPSSEEVIGETSSARGVPLPVIEASTARVSSRRDAERRAEAGSNAAGNPRIPNG